MKIKRFEASSMSEALRLIKKEFGEEAVILSAKTNKKGNFLKKKGAQKVVVTAAIDKGANGSRIDGVSAVDKDRQAAGGNEQLTDDKPVNKDNSILRRYNPITRTGQKILKPKIVQKITSKKQNATRSAFYQRFLESGLGEKMAAQWDEQLCGLLSDQDVHPQEIEQALGQVIQAKAIIGTTHKARSDGPKCMVMMGPSGVGKTSAVAKMAAKQVLQHPNAIAIISLDNQRVAGSMELERFSKIMGVPFKAAFSTESLKETLAQLNAYSLIVIDTPGVSTLDHIQREKLRRMLAVIDNSENLLLLNASLQERAMEKIIEYFRPLNIHSLFFTQLDWSVEFGAMINQTAHQKLPIGYLADSPKIPEGIRTATADVLAELLLGRYNVVDGGDRATSVIEKEKANNAPYYVANSNSDIFHFHECKSVRRINTDNMIVFKDPAEAMGQQFNTCSMCCSELIVPKPFDRLARGYAGNRY